MAKVKQDENEINRFIIVDMLGEKITTYESNKEIESKLFDKITSTNYEYRAFTKHLNKTNYISKKTIYELICEIGKNEPNTVEDVSIFSHAYSKGPILTNTDSDDPNDLDMRINDIKDKIFDYTNFKNAFTNDGIFKIWGCNMNRFTNNLIKQVMKSSKYKKDGTTLDSTIFTIKDTLFQNKDGSYNSVSQYIYSDCKTTPKNGIFEMTMLQIKK